MRRGIALGAVVGLVAIGAAVAGAVRPALLAASVPEGVLRAVERETVVPAAGVLLGAYAVWLAATTGRGAAADGGAETEATESERTPGAGAPTGDAEPRAPSPDERAAPTGTGGRGAAVTGSASAAAFDRLREAPPEAATSGDAAVLGSEFEGWVESAASNAASPDRARVRETLREAALEVEASGNVEDHAAAAAVDAGTWTDDRVAAAFLAENVAFPRRHRLHAWLDPESAMEGRIARTIDAIETRLEEREGGR